MRYLLIIAALSGLLQAQAPEFDAASIKPSPGGTRKSMTASPTRITFAGVSMRDCLMVAYDMKDYQITGPDWMRTERFNISAAAPGASAGTPAAEAPPQPNNGQQAPVLSQSMRMMLRKLLNDRFQMTLHIEKRELPVFALVVGKNGTRQLKESEAPGRSNMRMTGGTVSFTNVTIPELVDYMSQMRTAELDRPVVDNSGLKAQYDFTVKLFGTQEEMMAALSKGDFGTSIFTLIQEQLGLKLEPEKLPLDMIVVEKAEKAPTEN